MGGFIEAIKIVFFLSGGWRSGTFMLSIGGCHPDLSKGSVRILSLRSEVTRYFTILIALSFA